MSFDGKAFVKEMEDELISSGRGLENAAWIEKVSQGTATKEELVGWARQHYWGVTYHTRRFLSIWVGRIPYDMTDEVIENIAEEVLATEQKNLFGEGKSHLDWLFHFTRALGAPDDVIKLATPNADAVLSESLLYNFAHQRPWYEMIFGALMAIESQIPEAYKKVVAGFEEHYTDVLDPDDYKFHTVHIVVDEDHGGGMDELAEKYLDTDEKRRSARAAFFAGAESARRCWDSFGDVKW
jgi:pyrroloquinoline quinone (PQQ) biosynthesis protein C